MSRLALSFENPNIAGALVGCGVLASVGLIEYFTLKGRNKEIVGSLFLLLFLVMILDKTASRGAYLAVSLMLAVLIGLNFLSRVRSRRANLVVLLSLFLLLLVSVQTNERVSKVLNGDLSLTNRFYLWKASISLLLDNPGGVGPWFLQVHDYWYKDPELAPSYRHPINTLLVIWNAHGIVITLAIVILFIPPVVIYVYLRDGLSWQRCCDYIYCSFLALLIEAQFTYLFQSVTILIVFLIIAAPIFHLTWWRAWKQRSQLGRQFNFSLLALFVISTIFVLWVYLPLGLGRARILNGNGSSFDKVEARVSCVINDSFVEIVARPIEEETSRKFSLIGDRFLENIGLYKLIVAEIISNGGVVQQRIEPRGFAKKNHFRDSLVNYTSKVDDDLIIADSAYRIALELMRSKLLGGQRLFVIGGAIRIPDSEDLASWLKADESRKIFFYYTGDTGGRLGAPRFMVGSVVDSLISEFGARVKLCSIEDGVNRSEVYRILVEDLKL